MLSYSLSSNTLKSLRVLEFKLAKLLNKLQKIPKDELNNIHRYAKISMIGASTRIENALLTDSEVNWIDTILTKDGKSTAFESNKLLIEDKLSKDKERSFEEVAGCRKMLLTIYENSSDLFPLRETDLRGLHYELMSPYQKSINVGQYKTQTNSVVEQNHTTGSTKTIFKTADAGVITQSSMSDLIRWYNKAILKERWSLAVSCEFVFRFLAIHPFQDGNGRMGRGLFLLSLLQANQPIISKVAKYLAIDRQIEKHKEEYYFVLRKCSDGIFNQDPKQYKIKYFLRFMIKVINEACGDVLIYRKKIKYEKLLSKSSVLILSCFRDYPELRLTTKLIIEKTNLARRTVGNSLSVLIKYGFIQSYGQGAGTRYQITF